MINLNPFAPENNTLDIAERAWQGEIPASKMMVQEAGVVWFDGGDVGMVLTIANVGVIKTREGLVLIDTATPFRGALVREEIRKHTTLPVHTIVYTHGHLDHTMGAAEFVKEASEAGRPAPRIVAHANVPGRMHRYKATQGYNRCINARQFGPHFKFPVSFHYPTQTYDDALELVVGDTTLQLSHAKGETDDATWVWLPEHKILFSGDQFVWAVPNCGNPQKVQRYPKEWALNLRHMASMGARCMVPGHGPPIIGVERVAEALNNTAAFLESIVDQTLEAMNAGKTLDQVMECVKFRTDLYCPYLQPVYDDPAFIVRNVWRLYGGWYDGNPAHLKPPQHQHLAQELCGMVNGGAATMATRAEKLASEGRLDLASSLVEFAFGAAPDNVQVLRARAAVYQARTEQETSLMAKSIFKEAATLSAQQAEQSNVAE